ncbi:PEGA domain-containing protein [Terracidiphilus gabretensis]|uniref:PEGA domain-containing protein n=1 Tax=Terracidiphilus gabretensis TaxID=1577687 RepID=UPI00071B4492|nr:PEGA domain-containing protein [Terracidiphilus gabretensis]
MRSLLVVVFFSCSIALAQQAIPAPSTPTLATEQAQAQAPAGLPQHHTLLDGMPIKLRISQSISSADAKVGQEIPFEVIEDVKVDDIVVLPKGATAIGTVTDANPKRSMGRAGKLNISISYARLSDQEKVALRAMKDTKGGGHVGAMTGAMVATSIVFFPAAPLFLFIHGKDITIPQGTEITAFVQGDMHLDMSRFGAAPLASVGAVAAPISQASLIIESAPPGADIEIDGAFVGNTPSTVSVAPGTHEITVKKKGFTDWDRKLNVTGGSVHLDAELTATTVPAQ